MTNHWIPTGLYPILTVITSKDCQVKIKPWSYKTISSSHARCPLEKGWMVDQAPVQNIVFEIKN